MLGVPKMPTAVSAISENGLDFDSGDSLFLGKGLLSEGVNLSKREDAQI